MSRVLVTGGAGFIGSHLVEALVRRGDRVRVLDDLSTGSRDDLADVQQAIEFIEGDVADLATVQRVMQGVTQVVHVAAVRSIPRSLDDPGLCNRVNVDGTLNVLVAAREARVRRIVFSSSSSVYGDGDCYPAVEDQPLHPGSPYAVTKLVGELYARLFRELFGLEIVCLRYFNVFGPRMDAESGYAMAVPRFVASLLKGESPPVYGDGLQSRDFLYVENAVQAALRALEVANIGPGLFNIGSGTEISILDLIRILNRLLGTQIAPRHLPARAGEARRTLADTTQAREMLGFAPAVSLEEGLSRTIAWFRPRMASARSVS